jgi:heat shock protein HtpX
VFVTYAAGAVGVSLLVAAVWSDPEIRVTTALALGGTTILVGLLSYRFGTSQLLSGLDARELPRRQFPVVYETIDRLTQRMAVDSPTLYVARLGSPNALAVGGVRSGALIVDPSLLRLLSAAEQEAIFAHELAHLEHYDGLIQTLAYSCLRTVVGVCLLLLAPIALLLAGFSHAVALFRGQPETWQATSISTLYRVLVYGISGVLVVLTLLIRAHSRRREFAADDRAADVTGNPQALASALARIHRTTTDRWTLLSTLYIDGHDENPLTRLLSTHPPMEERIARQRHRDTTAQSTRR